MRGELIEEESEGRLCGKVKSEGGGTFVGGSRPERKVRNVRGGEVKKEEATNVCGGSGDMNSKNGEKKFVNESDKRGR